MAFKQFVDVDWLHEIAEIEFSNIVVETCDSGDLNQKSANFVPAEFPIVFSYCQFRGIYETWSCPRRFQRPDG